MTSGEEAVPGRAKRSKSAKRGRAGAPLGVERIDVSIDTALTGASVVHVAHDSLKAGCRCPACLEGTLYNYVPKKFIHFTSSAPIEATSTIVEQLRCGSCQLIFSATHPEGATSAMKNTADPSVTVMLAFLRYGYGMPFWRIADPPGRRPEGHALLHGAEACR